MRLNSVWVWFLQAEGHDIDHDEWHRHVHGPLKYDEFLSDNADLASMLKSVKIPKYIFTNADMNHALTCLDKIGIKDCFDDIISFDCMNASKALEQFGLDSKKNVLCKPDRRSFEYALKRVSAEAETTMFLDDNVGNIKAASDVGIQTVLVSFLVRHNKWPQQASRRTLQNLLRHRLLTFDSSFG